MRELSVWAVFNSKESAGGEWVIHSLWHTMKDAQEQADELNEDEDIYDVHSLDIN